MQILYENLTNLFNAGIANELFPLILFIVIGAIILATVLVNKIFSEEGGKKVDAFFDRILFDKKK